MGCSNSTPADSSSERSERRMHDGGRRRNPPRVSSTHRLPAIGSAEQRDSFTGTTPPTCRSNASLEDDIDIPLEQCRTLAARNPLDNQPSELTHQTNGDRNPTGPVSNSVLGHSDGRRPSSEWSDIIDGSLGSGSSLKAPKKSSRFSTGNLVFAENTFHTKRQITPHSSAAQLQNQASRGRGEYGGTTTTQGRHSTAVTEGGSSSYGSHILNGIDEDDHQTGEAVGVQVLLQDLIASDSVNASQTQSLRRHTSERLSVGPQVPNFNDSALCVGSQNSSWSTVCSVTTRGGGLSSDHFNPDEILSISGSYLNHSVDSSTCTSSTAATSNSHNPGVGGAVSTGAGYRGADHQQQHEQAISSSCRGSLASDVPPTGDLSPSHRTEPNSTFQIYSLGDCCSTSTINLAKRTQAIEPHSSVRQLFDLVPTALETSERSDSRNTSSASRNATPVSRTHSSRSILKTFHDNRRERSLNNSSSLPLSGGPLFDNMSNTSSSVHPPPSSSVVPPTLLGREHPARGAQRRIARSQLPPLVPWDDAMELAHIEREHRKLVDGAPWFLSDHDANYVS